MDAFDQFVSSMFTLDRWPFWSAVLVFTFIGYFTAKRLFTKERAYAQTSLQWFWYWGRESLILHPIAAGVLLGFFWPDPEGRKWPQAASCMYFAAAGAVSLVAWVVIKGIAKQKGYSITLPGDSDRPSSSPDTSN